MAVISGLLTAIQGIPSVAKWSVTWQEEAPLVISTATKGAAQSVCGVVDWRGQILCYGHTPAYLPGDTLTFRASLDGQTGVYGEAYVAEVRVIGDVRSKREIMMAYQLVGNGELSFGNVDVTDTVAPVMVCPIHPILLDDTTEIPHVTFWQVVLKQALPEFVSTSTGGVRKRLPGVFQAMVQWRQLLADAPPLAVGDEHALTIVIVPSQGGNPPSGWRFSAVRVQQVAEYGVDLPAVLQQAYHEYEMTTVFQPISNNQQQTIVDPSERQVWPRSGS